MMYTSSGFTSELKSQHGFHSSEFPFLRLSIPVPETNDTVKINVTELTDPCQQSIHKWFLNIKRIFKTAQWTEEQVLAYLKVLVEFPFHPIFDSRKKFSKNYRKSYPTSLVQRTSTSSTKSLGTLGRDGKKISMNANAVFKKQRHVQDPAFLPQRNTENVTDSTTSSKASQDIYSNSSSREELTPSQWPFNQLNNKMN